MARESSQEVLASTRIDPASLGCVCRPSLDDALRVRGNESWTTSVWAIVAYQPDRARVHELGDTSRGFSEWSLGDEEAASLG